MRSSDDTGQKRTFRVITQNSSPRSTKRSKRTKRVKVKIKQKYETSVTSISQSYDKDIGENSVVFKNVNRRGKVASGENKSIEEIQGCEDVDNRLYSCKLCPKMFTSNLSLNSHKKVHSAKDYECEICGKKFRRQSSLRKHAIYHSDDSPYRCPICGKYSKSKERATLHLRTHSGDKPYQCDRCGKNFTQIGNLQLHKKNIHAPESVFKCDICYKEFEYNKDLISHLLTHSDGNVLKCYECGKMFGKREHFEKHKELHKEVRPFSCDICGNTYKKNSDLKCHLDTHDVSQGYVCHVCGRSFSYKSSLKYHLRIHSGDMPYSCDICGKAFRTSSNRSKHVLSHTNYKPFSCDQCSKSFRDNRSLVIHKRTHSGHRPYQCPICLKSFIVQTELNRHRKKLHQNAVECDYQKSRNISTECLSSHSNDTEYVQRERPVGNTYDEIARDRVEKDVTNSMTGGNHKHASATSEGDDHTQLFLRETTTSLSGTPAVNSNYTQITSPLGCTTRPIHNVSTSDVDITNPCQYEMSVRYPGNHTYGFELLTGNGLVPCERESAHSTYMVPSSSLCPPDNNSPWINNLESQNQSSMNASPSSHTNIHFFSRDGGQVMGPILQLSSSSGDVQYRISNLSGETKQRDVVPQCGDANQSEVTLQHAEAPITAPHKDIFVARTDVMSEPVENSFNRSQNTDGFASDVIKESCVSEEGSGKGNSLSLDNCGSKQDNSQDEEFGEMIRDRCNSEGSEKGLMKCGSIRENSQEEEFGKMIKNRCNSDGTEKELIKCRLIQEGIQDERNPMNTHGSSLGCGNTDRLSGRVVLSGFVPGMNSSFDGEKSTNDEENSTYDREKSTIGEEKSTNGEEKSTYDGEKSAGDGSLSTVEDVTIHEKYNMDEETDTEIIDLEIKSDVVANDKDDGNEPLEQFSVQLCESNSENRRTPTEDMHKDEKKCQKSALGVSVIKRSRKCQSNMRVKSKNKERNLKQNIGLNSKTFVSSNKVHKKSCKNMADLCNSACPLGNDKLTAMRKRRSELQIKPNDQKSDKIKELVSAICNKQKQSRNKLEKHMMIKHPSEVLNSKEFKCQICNTAYPSKLSLQGHVRLHKNRECPICHKKFRRPAYLNRHMLVHTNENPYRCPYCSKDFVRQNSLRSHLRTHTGNKPYQCDVCGTRFAQQTQLMSHKKQHAPDKSFRCDDCGVEFVDNQELLSHITVHGREANKCKVCGKVFGRLKHLQKHEEIHDYDRRRYQCNYCDNRFLNKNDRQNHESIHTEDRSFSCEYCGKQFRHKSGLNYHIRTHTGEKPYPCKTCGKSFRTNSYLHKHMMFHTGYRPYKCDTCEKGFTCKNDLISHTRTHTGERPYSCPICEKAFKEVTTMKKHVLSIHTCSYCGKTFRERSDLGMHVMSHQIHD